MKLSRGEAEARRAGAGAARRGRAPSRSSWSSARRRATPCARARGTRLAVVAADCCDDLRDPQRPPPPPASAGLRLRVRVGVAGQALACVLMNRRSPARPARFVGVVDVAAGDARQGRLAAPEARGHDREQRAGSRRGLPAGRATVREQAAAAGLADVEHLVEAVGVAVVRIRHRRRRRGESGSKARKLWTRSRSSAVRASRSSVVEDAAVHRQDVVEAREVAALEAAGDAVQRDAAALRGGAGAGVGRLAGVPVAGAAALDGDPICRARPPGRAS